MLARQQKCERKFFLLSLNFCFESPDTLFVAFLFLICEYSWVNQSELDGNKVPTFQFSSY